MPTAMFDSIDLLKTSDNHKEQSKGMYVLSGWFVLEISYEDFQNKGIIWRVKLAFLVNL